MNGSLTILRGPQSKVKFFDPRGLPDFEAGLLFFNSLLQAIPDLTWEQFISSGMKKRYAAMGCPMPGRMGEACSWWDLVCKAQNLAGDIKDAVVDTVNYFSDKGGDVLRLITDPKVLDTVSRAAQAYVTSGGSEAARAALQQGLATLTPEQRQAVINALPADLAKMIESAGIASKAQWSEISFKNPIVWGVGGVTLISLAAYLFKKK